MSSSTQSACLRPWHLGQCRLRQLLYPDRIPPQPSQAYECPPRAGVRHRAMAPRVRRMYAFGLYLCINCFPNRPMICASSYVGFAIVETIKGIERAVGFYLGALGNVQINHGRGNFGMSQELFKGNNVKPLFEQMGSIGMSERV